MQHLVDERAPITNEDITKAQHDARRLLELQARQALTSASDAADVIRRLLAIVDYTYGSVDVPTLYRPAPERASRA